MNNATGIYFCGHNSKAILVRNSRTEVEVVTKRSESVTSGTARTICAICEQIY